MHTKWDIRFLEMARLVSMWSKDPSTKVGAVIVRPDRTVASVGFNGFPREMPDRPEWYEDRKIKYSRIVHGEINALIHAHTDVRGCTLYTYPFAPCDRCTVQVLQSGVKRFVFPEPTTDAISRWGEAFNLTKSYIEQCNAEYEEIPHNIFPI